jgi:RNA polymerase sigma-70 factor, ECF subfamily
MENDTELIEGALNGSLQAWETLVRRYESRVYNFSLRLTGDRDDAMDLMQDVFLGVYRNLDRFRGDAQFSSWVFRIAHNKAIDLARRRHASPVQDMDIDQLPEPGSAQDSPHTLLMNERGNQSIQAMLDSLGPDLRLLVELKVFQEMTFEDIAELQDVSANTVKTRFYTAMKKLRNRLENQDALSPNS